MNETRVIGIGSPFRNDDIGWRVIDHLRKRPDLPETIDLVAADRPGVKLLHMLQDALRVILVDALIDADRHGEIILLNREQLATAGRLYSSHGLDVAAALKLAEKLEILPAQLTILAMAIDPERGQIIDDQTIEQLGSRILQMLAPTQRTTRAGYSCRGH